VSFDALTRYRIMAYITGVLLLVLVAAMLVKYVGSGDGRYVDIVAPMHGWVYAVYLVATLDLAVRRRWGWLKSLLVVLAGTIPFASFVAERRVVKDEQRRILQEAGQQAGQA
jgi:integral membrane protein